MPKKTDKPVCGAVFFGAEVVRCQLAAGHDGDHDAGGLWWPKGATSLRQAYKAPTKSYQAQVQKRATLKRA